MFAMRPLFATLMVAVMLLASSTETMAGRQWCKKDPVFLVAGTSVNVEVSVPWDDQNRVNGAVAVILYVPKGVDASLVSTDDGFGGYGEVASVVVSSKLRATRTSVQIRVVVTVPVTGKSMLVNVVVIPENGRSGSVNGRANSDLSVTTTVKPTA
jgi:GTPase